MNMNVFHLHVIILLSIFTLFCISVSLSGAAAAAPLPQEPATSPLTLNLLPRVKIDRGPDIVTCSRNQRRILVSVLREASRWTQLALDTTRNRRWQDDSDPEYEAWREARRNLFVQYYGDFRSRTRAEMSSIFELLKWELDRSPGGRLQNEDQGGNVQLFCDERQVRCTNPGMYSARTRDEDNQFLICPRFFRDIERPIGGARVERFSRLPREPSRMALEDPEGLTLTDKSQIGHMIITLLEMRAVARRGTRIQGGTLRPGGLPNQRVMIHCLHCEKFVTGRWFFSLFWVFEI
ncbi:MAG: hypothetical protein Q9160_008431 [Pyrenula sp. 1 TL-2023]